MGCCNSKVRRKTSVKCVDSNDQNEQPSSKEWKCTQYPANKPLTAEQKVHLALEEYLPDYNFNLPLCQLKGLGFQTDNPAYIMKVRKGEEFTLNPDPAGTKLSYNLLSTKYELHVGAKDGYLFKFIYQWAEGDKTFLTSPYHFKDMKIDDNIPCACPVDISGALMSPQPIEAIISGLELLESNKQNLKGSNFDWIMDGAYGVAFTLHSVLDSQSLFWKDIDDGVVVGNVQMTENRGQKLILGLYRVQI